jgi:ankyrin repeat protein
MKKNHIGLKAFLSAAFVFSAIGQGNSMVLFNKFQPSPLELDRRKLFDAIKSKNRALVESIINFRGNNPNMRYIVMSSLLLAVESGYLPVIRSLVARGADVNTFDGCGNTALHYAVRTGNTAVAEFLVNSHADVRARPDCGNNLLYFAVLSGKTDMVELLLEKCRADLTASDKRLIFEETIRSRKTDIIKFLFDDLYEENDDFFKEILLKSAFPIRPLEMCEFIAERCGTKLIDELYEKEDAPSKEALLQFIFPVRSLKIAEFIVEKWGAKLDNDVHRKSMLVRAAVEGNTDMVKLLMAHGADINMVDRWGDTILHHAIKSKNINLVRFLVKECCANINARNYRGETPLHHAVVKDMDIVLFLLRHNADFNAIDSYGYTPINLYSMMSRITVDILDFLKNHDPNFNANDNGEDTLLHHAARFENIDAVKFLVNEYGADVNARNREGDTPLHFAARSGRIDAVKFLVDECGVNPGVQNDAGMTPLDILPCFYEDVVEFLGAKIWEQATNG